MVRPSRDFERLNTSLFRGFMAAAETLNFTRAAEKAGMTQSGISQHIAKLESDLDTELFTRTNRAVLLTPAGHALVDFIEKYLDQTDEFYEGIQNSEKRLGGCVSYAMPGSCLYSPHLTLMLEQRNTHENIELRILVRPNEEIVRLVLEGQIDFGFLTESIAVTGLVLRPFCNEEFIYVGPKHALPIDSDLDSILATNFVSYPGADVYFNCWQQHYFPKVSRRYFESLNIKGHIESIHGAVTLAVEGVGCTVIPRHCVVAQLAAKELRIFKPDIKRAQLFNTISIAHLEARKLPRRVDQVMEWFFSLTR